MIKYGLKIWSNNTDWFEEAVERHKREEFDFVEIYSNSEVAHDYLALEKLKQIPVLATHIGHLDKAGFHDFFLTKEQEPAWQMTRELTDFFEAPRIVVHPANNHNPGSFWENLKKLNDERIIIETMPVISPLGGENRKFGTNIDDIIEISKQKKICLDICKSIKAAVYHDKPYKEFLLEILGEIEPEYMHISGCDLRSPIDQHLDLWEAEFDVKWIRETIEEYAKDKVVYLAFETPKSGKGLENDIKNIEYFKTIKQ